ncbi:hypothetical protein Bca52824_013678 [Brassica carinata]|uniref:NAC domain-containing protein n=1 Tax=Brassica carinata TaxID=52824 RepID=A0A8X7W0T8_BRACI|nr:hypothetical protein Bca52824_013678 [Brassica carinata]
MANSCLKGGRFSAPGFRFHPTDEELVVYYLKRKICGRKLRINAIGVVDVYKVDPTELPGLSVLKSGDRQWFYFTPRNRKHPNAARSSRGTATGYWKATGKDRVIVYNSRSVGLKKTLVFYRGRAPNGERTDWVMHEYTMDEEELGRCKNAKEYYALYKLYKKSGAGPKNGEEYGAPFQEEEWVDDDDDDDDREEADNVTVPDDHVVRYENNRRIGDGIFCNPVNVQSDDLDKLLSGIPYAPGIAPRQMNDLSGVMQVNSQEEIQSTLLNDSSGGFLSPWEVGMFLPNRQPNSIHSSYQPHAANSFDGSEVKSAFKASGIAPFVFEKEDYIEMDDLLTPEQGAASVEKPAQFSNPGEYEHFNDYDQLFHDVSMSFDTEHVFQGTSTDLTSLNNFNLSNEGRQHFLYQQQFQNQTLETSQANSFMDPNPNANEFVDDLWFKDAQADLNDQPQSSSLAFASPSSGVIPESKNPAMSVTECQNGGETRSQFSSAMWALLDSIPSTPASACEGPVNRTFVRMSSLSRIRFNGTSVTTTSKVAVAKKGIGNRGFLLLSVMGAMCAFFWVFIIATVGVQGRHRDLNIS